MNLGLLVIMTIFVNFIFLLAPKSKNYTKLFKKSSSKYKTLT
jgi:hypothetical protein